MLRCLFLVHRGHFVLHLVLVLGIHRLELHGEHLLMALLGLGKLLLQLRQHLVHYAFLELFQGLTFEGLCGRHNLADGSLESRPVICVNIGTIPTGWG